MEIAHQRARELCGPQKQAAAKSLNVVEAHKPHWVWPPRTCLAGPGGALRLYLTQREEAMCLPASKPFVLQEGN